MADVTAEASSEVSVPTLPPDVTVQTVSERVEADDVVIIDVREDWEFTEGHIPGAQWLPLGELSQRTAEVPTDVPVILVCRSGNRSGQAYQFLRQQGFENVHNMEGGMLAWIEAGYPTDP